MHDLKRMKNFYDHRKSNVWSIFNCYPFFLDCKQTWMMSKILNTENLAKSRYLDIGAGEGNFILKMISFGIQNKNITAIEYLKNRYEKLMEKLPHIQSVNDDFLNVKLEDKYDIITLMAVLTSITDNDLRYSILDKALDSLEENGMLIVYDYFDEKENFLNENYRALSLKKTQKLAEKYSVTVYRNVYIKSKYAKGLCKLRMQVFIPVLESLKIFNDSYHFVVIKNEK